MHLANLYARERAWRSESRFVYKRVVTFRIRTVRPKAHTSPNEHQTQMCIESADKIKLYIGASLLWYSTRQIETLQMSLSTIFYFCL